MNKPAWLVVEEYIKERELEKTDRAMMRLKAVHDCKLLTHFEHNENSWCGMISAYERNLTTDQDKVTCKRCRKIMPSGMV